MKASTPVVVTHTPPTAPFFPICVALLVGGFVFLTGAVGFLFLQQATSGHHADFQLSELQRQVAEHHQLLHAHIGRGSEPPRKPPKVPGCLRWILD
mmetsp:Transcript_13478/g.43281  ORF Transcript_13478/g.43281 Transcript_13478/m.43281 type:complete len:96 (+) Transcript_13478:33-320(+)